MEGKKKLLLINVNQFGYSAGHYYYCKYLKDKFEIEFVCFDKGHKKMSLNGVKVHYVSFTSGKILRTYGFIKTCFDVCNIFKPDTLFVVYFKFCFLLPLFCKAQSKILDIRTGSLAPNKIKRKIDNTIYHLQSLFFSRTVVLSDSLRKLLGIKENKCLLLPLGSEIFYSGEHDFSSLNLLYVGSFNGRRIYETIEGVSLFLKKFPEAEKKITYMIIGFGSEKEELTLQKAIEQNDLASIVFFNGRKNYEELTPYFEKANIGIAYVPITEYYETQPSTKIFEYVLSGMFTISTNNSENSKLINSTNGVLCKDTPLFFAESLAKCYEKRLALNSIAIRNTLSEFSWENLVRNKLNPFLIKNLSKHQVNDNLL